ncbi:ASCH domain-containing protein [Gryllotalpicola protaetiae]|uniref:ASCH domain-containing protein n=1 Tax=Gryllotalpicola protaetiae TaxID=2419771 RepID=A0A387BQR5_9MICO|nr:ASCH domain-containing protein [Gryllotalpicola protaetiae]AYG04892.1 ASCH domain-containing protein [Gryllotalpicola protaetiae]
MTDAAIRRFWDEARAAVPALPAEPPDSWAFGAEGDRSQADELLTLVLRGGKTATASSLWDYEAAREPLPVVGTRSIVLDGAGAPRAVLETTQVSVVSFDCVDAAHAAAEGEGDRTLDSWRRFHESFWRLHSENERGFAPDMPVVCERFRVVYASWRADF